MTDFRSDLTSDHGDDHVVLAHRIATLLQNGRVGLAKTHLQDALRRFPKSEWLIYYRACIELHEGNDASAQQTLAHLFSAFPDHQHGRRLLAALYERRGRIDDAERIWESLIKQSPEDAGLLGLYALFLLRRRSRFEAAEIAERGVKIDPEDRHCLRALAVCEVLNNPWESAQPRLESLLRSFPDRIESGVALILSLELQGRSREALEVARGLLADRPHSAELVSHVQRLMLKTHWTMFPLWPFVNADREVAGATTLGLVFLLLSWPFWYDGWAAPVFNVLLAAFLGYVVIEVLAIKLLIYWAVRKSRRS